MLRQKHGQFRVKDHSVAEEKSNGKKRMGWEFREIRIPFKYPKRAIKELHYLKKKEFWKKNHKSRTKGQLKWRESRGERHKDLG